MVQVTPSTASDLEDFIEAYESSRQRLGSANLTEFLPDSSHPRYGEIAAELIRVDMEYSWESGPQHRLDDYRRLLPDVLADMEVLQEVAYEEYRLRVQAGEPASPDQYSRRYSIDTKDWRQFSPKQFDAGFSDDHSRINKSINATWDDALQLVEDVSEFPAVGENFLGFQLENELGQGAFARVYLARQEELADRQVVLKIASGRTLEPQHLARLQHTNIVPVYSVHKLNQLTAVCMPFLGPRTLADVVRDLGRSELLPHSGQALLGTVVAHDDPTHVVDERTTQEPAPLNSVIASLKEPAAATRLAQTNYVDSVIWLISQIADGLGHAHEQGIVHRDLKPANILLTHDGRPMILDFNLSEDLVVNGRSTLMVGGTLPYMSPEQLEAVAAGGTVDFRSDVYSLGVIFFELLAGRRPFDTHHGSFEEVVHRMVAERRGPAPSVRQFNTKAPQSVASIVSRCLQFDASLRYQSVEQLREDLRRQAENRPLLHAPNTSWRERTVKWARRHPRISSAGSVAAMSAVALFVASFIGMRLWANRAFQQFTTALPAARTALSIPEIEPALLKDGVRTVRNSLEQYGILSADDRNNSLKYRLLAAEKRVKLRQNLSELAYLLSNAIARSAHNGERQTAFEEALSWNSFATGILSTDQMPRAFSLQRARLLEALGDEQRAAELRASAEEQPHGGPLDEYLEVQRLLSVGEYKAALTPLTLLRDRSPTDPVYWLSLGYANAALGRLKEAEGCFTTSKALLPESHLSLHLRGLCRMDLKEYQAALQDFEDMVKLRPDLSPCLLNRALAHAALGNYQQAVADYTTALELGASETRIYFLRARSLVKLGDYQAAAQDRAEGLRLTPVDEDSWVARGIARLATDPEGALADFRQALAINPPSITALKNIVHVTADRLDRPDEALEALNQILSLQKENLFALAGRAVLQARQGKRTAALADVQQLLRLSKEPTHLFQAACALSHTSQENDGDATKGLLLLSKAVLQNPRFLRRAKTDPDLANLRENPRFQVLVNTAAIQ